MSRTRRRPIRTRRTRWTGGASRGARSPCAPKHVLNPHARAQSPRCKVSRAQIVTWRPAHFGDTARSEALISLSGDSLPPPAAVTRPTAPYLAQSPQNHGWTFAVVPLSLDFRAASMWRLYSMNRNAASTNILRDLVARWVEVLKIAFSADGQKQSPAMHPCPTLPDVMKDEGRERGLAVRGHRGGLTVFLGRRPENSAADAPLHSQPATMPTIVAGPHKTRYQTTSPWRKLLNRKGRSQGDNRRASGPDGPSLQGGWPAKSAG